MPTVEEKLRTLVAQLFTVDESEVTANANLQEDLGADSLDQVELVMNIEEEFDLEIPDDVSDEWKTFGDVLKYVTEGQR